MKNEFGRPMNQRRFAHGARRMLALVLAMMLLIPANLPMALAEAGEGQPAVLICGREAHEHSEACYADVLICGQEERAPVTEEVRTYVGHLAPHKHTDACRDASGKLVCGIVEGEYYHTHNDYCYDNGSLVCGLKEKVPHKHSDSCYEDIQTLVCQIMENPGHQHTDACYSAVPTLVCGQEEVEGVHGHSEACYAMVPVLACGLEEGAGAHWHGPECYAVERVLKCTEGEPVVIDGVAFNIETLTSSSGDWTTEQVVVDEGHAHTEACYERQLVCGLEEHVHTEACYQQPEAVEAGANNEENTNGTNDEAPEVIDQNVVADPEETDGDADETDAAGDDNAENIEEDAEASQEEKSEGEQSEEEESQDQEEEKETDEATPDGVEDETDQESGEETKEETKEETEEETEEETKEETKEETEEESKEEKEETKEETGDKTREEDKEADKEETVKDTEEENEEDTEEETEEETEEDTEEETEEETEEGAEEAPAENKEYIYAISGAQDVRLSEALVALEAVAADEIEAFMAQIETVTVSDEEAVQLTADDTDWILRSLKQTEEPQILTLIMLDGSEHAITLDVSGLTQVAADNAVAVISTVDDMYLPEDASADAAVLPERNSQDAIAAVENVTAEVSADAAYQVIDIALDNVDSAEYEGFEVQVNLDESLVGRDCHLDQVQDGVATALTDSL